MHIGVQAQDPDTVIIIQPIDKRAYASRQIDDVLKEINGLAQAISLDVFQTRVVNYSKIHAGSFFGKGTRSDIGDEIASANPVIVIVNCALSPIQQRNLEKEWDVKVIDRTGLILEIFGARAQTKEGRLQVALAALAYQKSRLVRSWTHLERQRGGAGFMGGPGERQIELDRRMIADKIIRLKKDLENVRRTRDLGRKSRERVPFPIVSLVGYTNAGKSTLFNNITNADVFAEDLLFATLDPTMRRITLPQNQNAILADTVGFIADLPTHLVAAFRATLEQITHADVIVHVIDASRKDYIAQKNDVIKILEDLGIEYETDDRIIEVYNKTDLLDEDSCVELSRQRKISKMPMILISAYKNHGIDGLLNQVAEITVKNRQDSVFNVSISDGKAIAWLYSHGDVLQREDSDTDVKISLRLADGDQMKFEKEFGYKAEKELRSR
ncbi:MAG: GTPase HflX [Zetaproteobacteria bacterium]|nr:MAG: GTPase HflX [Zetaproteobacteria bacterium]